MAFISFIGLDLWSGRYVEWAGKRRFLWSKCVFSLFWAFLVQKIVTISLVLREIMYYIVTASSASPLGGPFRLIKKKPI